MSVAMSCPPEGNRKGNFLGPSAICPDWEQSIICRANQHSIVHVDYDVLLSFLPQGTCGTSRLDPWRGAAQGRLTFLFGARETNVSE